MWLPGHIPLPEFSWDTPCRKMQRKYSTQKDNNFGKYQLDLSKSDCYWLILASAKLCNVFVLNKGQRCLLAKQKSMRRERAMVYRIRREGSFSIVWSVQHAIELLVFLWVCCVYLQCCTKKKIKRWKKQNTWNTWNCYSFAWISNMIWIQQDLGLWQWHLCNSVIVADNTAYFQTFLHPRIHMRQFGSLKCQHCWWQQ